MSPLFKKQILSYPYYISIVELGKKEMLRWELIFFPRNLYSKAIGHVGPHALDRDLSQVFKNMCFDQKRSFVAACGACKPQKTACFWCGMKKLYMFINLLQIILPSKSRLQDLHKTTTESSLWENYIFLGKSKNYGFDDIFTKPGENGNLKNHVLWLKNTVFLNN